MLNQFSRTEVLLGRKAMEILLRSRVAVFGIGGVGGYVAEALARSGVGHLELIDHDKVCLTNLNRQIIAAHSTIGQDKADVMRRRILDINPDAEVCVRKCFYLPENQDQFDFSRYSYVVDAVDTVTAKIALVLQAQASGVPVISSMGTGNKLDPSRLEVTDIYKTSVCPLAKVMRRELKRRGVKSLKVVYSREEPIRPERGGTLDKDFAVSDAASGDECWEEIQNENPGRRSTPGSVVFVPAAAGLLIASQVVKDLTGR